MRSLSSIFLGSEHFRLKINVISTLGAKCYLVVVKNIPDKKINTFWKVLPGRGQNANFHAFSKGTDRGFSRIFVDFAFFNSFWAAFWTLPGSEWLPNAFIFLHFLWIRAIFGSKSMKFRRLVQSVTRTSSELSALAAKRYLDVTRSVPDVKIRNCLQSVTWTCSKRDEFRT